MLQKLFYLSRYELIKMLNQKNTDIYIKIIICTIIMYKTSNWFVLKDKSILESSSIELFFRSLEKEITISDVTKILNLEMNIFVNIFVTDNFQSISDIERLYSSDSIHNYDQNILVNLFKENVISICPEKYRLTISVLLETGELYYDNYDYYDKIFINSFLKSIGYSVKPDIQIPMLNKLDTIQKKALFLFYLNSKSKDLFILLVSMKDLSNLFLFLDSMSDNENIINIIDAIDIIETCISLSISATENNFLDNQQKELFFSLTKDIILNGGITLQYTDLLKNGISMLDELHQEELSKQINNNSNNLKKLGFLSNKLKQEISDQINVASLINSI